MKDKIKDGLIPAFTTKKEFVFLDGAHALKDWVFDPISCCGKRVVIF